MFTNALRRRAALTLSLVLAGLAFAAEPITAQYIARLRSVDAVAIAPDGKSIAYALRVPRVPGKDKDGPAWVELHVVGPAGDSRPFVTGEVNIGNIGWTPDSRGISFIAKLKSDENECLYVIPLDGGEARQILRHESDIGGYAFSPDGKQVAFLAKPAEDKKKKELKEKGFKQEVYEEESRPTRAWLADVQLSYTSPSSSPSTSPSTQNSAPSTQRFRSIEFAGSASSIRWSRDGSKIGLKISATPLIDDVMMFSRVRTFDATTLAKLGEIETIGKLGDFQFSPDGKHVALIAAADINDPAAGRLVSAVAAGGPAKDILPGYLAHVSDIAWQDADTIMFVGQEGCEASFGKIDLDGSNRKTILPPGGPILTGFSLAADGQSGAFVADSSQHPAEVFAMKHGDPGPRRVTESNSWLKGIQLAKQEVLKYKARDGLELEGILIHPLEEQAGTRYPLVMIVHGGPEAHESNGWKTTYNRPGHLLAARGFVTFLPNYRGSTGRGVEFSKLGQRDYGGKEFDDLVDAVDHLVSIGLVDKAKVGVTGGSYGGYATAWCATKLSDRFAAGVMAVGLSDKLASFGTTDIPQEMYLVHARVWPWEDPKFYYERSPVAYATQAKTPLLILGGKDDTRVHPSQSFEMYRFIKTATKTPVRLVQYPGEGHGNTKASSRYDYTLRLVQWMEHYLKGPGGAPPGADVDYALEGFEK
jgi:dipeptidyl aminopeptidase/acylaminoacyl peptidase